MKNRDFDILQVKTHTTTNMYTFGNNKETVVYKDIHSIMSRQRHKSRQKSRTSKQIVGFYGSLSKAKTETIEEMSAIKEQLVAN